MRSTRTRFWRRILALSGAAAAMALALQSAGTAAPVPLTAPPIPGAATLFGPLADVGVATENMSALKTAPDVAVSGKPVTPELSLDFEEALARLPEGARQVFVLHDVEGYRHEEIARMLGVVPGTSKSQLHHARMALRRHLDR